MNILNAIKYQGEQQLNAIKNIMNWRMMKQKNMLLKDGVKQLTE